jgi:hypothetical protein
MYSIFLILMTISTAYPKVKPLKPSSTKVKSISICKVENGKFFACKPHSLKNTKCKNQCGSTAIVIVNSKNITINMCNKTPLKSKKNNINKVEDLKNEFSKEISTIKRKTLPEDPAQSELPLFSTAHTVPKGHTYFDFRVFGLYSGFGYGVTDRLEVGIRTIVPLFAEGGSFLYTFHFNAKYKLIDFENVKVAVSITAPLFRSEIITTIGNKYFSVTAGLCTIFGPEFENFIPVWNLAAKIRVSKNVKWIVQYNNLYESSEFSQSLHFLSTGLRIHFESFMIEAVGGVVTEGNFSAPLGFINAGYRL